MIIDTLPELCTTPHAERQRQALMGYDDLPGSKKRQHLRLHVYASNQLDEFRLGENDFQTLVNRLPVATSCHEARAIVIKVLRARTTFLDLFCTIEDELRNGRLILEPLFTDMTTVMVTTSRGHPEDAPEGFDSPHQVVDVITRVFGSGVKKIIWSAWCQPGFAMTDIYSPHTPHVDNADEDGWSMIDKSGHGATTHFMSPDRVLHVETELYKAAIPDGSQWWDTRVLYRHTLKISELLSAAAIRLPQLQQAELRMRTSSWGEQLETNLETTYKDNVIWIGANNLNTAPSHWFSRDQ
ncbi:hypothetical protein C7974DRAFT_161992 [Boeremia exigua]|uniref:uncharacterized protein n=1 Tax=Boeremia exigua TaxID=749465 RepID=UPI001E8ED229|nr:uncharacterized protein C7974DRAFT_161992 [Boeremia exigua]KAH6632895.1 hypothetical protein C7974DRAFT_161992 [Boeremia exigua]